METWSHYKASRFTIICKKIMDNGEHRLKIEKALTRQNKVDKGFFHYQDGDC